MKPAPARPPRVLLGILFLLGGLSLFTPLWPELAPERRVGALLCAAAIVELIAGFRRDTHPERSSAWIGGAITLGMGTLLINAPHLIGRAITYLVAGWFAIDGARYLWRAGRARHLGASAAWELAAAAGNWGVVIAILLLGGQGTLWTVAIAGALRIFGAAVQIRRAPRREGREQRDSVLLALGLADQPEIASLAARLEQEERDRRPVDRGWIATFLITLFAIHLGRMGLDRSALGIISPGFAVFGDIVAGLIAAYLVLIPGYLLLRRILLPIERRLWIWCLQGASPTPIRLWTRAWLTRRLRRAIRLRRAGRSISAALGRGLQIGLPVAAVIAATTPMLGMSWYFDTENWAAGIWDSWAEARTDTWREAMIRSVQGPGAGEPGPAAHSMRPAGVADGADFSFVVIGDTGEGDASQHVLRDQIILAMQPQEARFLLLSSDVVYPTGAMRHYEANFWLPFKGVTKPVYAIPGNHDWYDALEAFAATFMERDAALASMRARAEADLRLTGGSEKHFQSLVETAGRLRREYGVPTGFQRAPFFQIQTREFALFALDTGVRKRVDPLQMAWFRAALGTARGKFKMVILGHPLYAVGEYQAAGNAEFAELHGLLREHGVRIVMAGDTHDLEYYAEPVPGSGTNAPAVMHHFVNGGGGAFLSIGAALTPARRMPTATWTRYPSQPALVAKIEGLNPFWKKPAWLWTRWLNGWPFSAEWLSAAFDYNVAPFFQSFLVVRVENSTRRVILQPWGVRGRLRWSEVESSALPPGADPQAAVEWSIPMDGEP